MNPFAELPAVLASAVRLGRALESDGALIACAESCTGGLIAAALTEIGGSSRWFDRGFVTYSNEAKQDLLGVSQQSLQRFGAVSEPVAREMAQGALRRSRARIALAVTGIAGPGGGSPDKPVGTVCFAWALRGETADDGSSGDAQSASGPAAQADVLHSVTRHFGGGRSEVRAQTAQFALDEALKLLPRTASTDPQGV